MDAKQRHKACLSYYHKITAHIKPAVRSVDGIYSVLNLTGTYYAKQLDPLSVLQANVFQSVNDAWMDSGIILNEAAHNVLVELKTLNPKITLNLDNYGRKKITRRGRYAKK